jgi:hypothetical protein
MNHRLHPSLAAACGLFFAVAMHAADTTATSVDVALYLAPDATTPAFLHVPASDARLANAQPTANGWESVTLPGPFTAYVQSNRIHKDLTVIAGTPVYAGASSSSAVLGNASDNPPLSIQKPEVDWSEVSFPGPLAVYFQMNAPSAPATPAAATLVTATPVAVTAAPVSPTAVTALPAAATVTAVSAAPADVPHYYYGVLKLRTNPFISGPINAGYVLYSDKGQFIALVDLSNVVLGSPVADYLDKSIKIYGTTYTASNLPSVVINAQMLQVN